MKRVAGSFVMLALGAVVLGAVSKPILGYAAPVPVRHIGIASGTIARALAIVAPIRMRDDEGTALVRRQVREAQAGTYIDDILRERDSALIRWPDRRGVPLTVWIQPAADIADFMPGLVESVRNAFIQWDQVRLPVRFAFVRDSSHADVHVTWIDHFSEPISGRTHWSHDEDFVITDADITLAVHHSQGDPLGAEAMSAMALHEIGHLLGLDHTTDSLAIMAPRVRVRQLADADRATARLLYALPAGPLR